MGGRSIQELLMIVWTYVITIDNGGAPNYLPPATTLALCKPKIRQLAGRGDLVLGFNGQSLHPDPHSVQWAGVVGEVLPLEDYWNDPRFEGKRPGRSNGTPDNIYRPTPVGLEQVPNPKHGAAERADDVGGRNVLIFRNVWHFGPLAPRLPAHFRLRMPENARRGHRRWEISDETSQELKQWLDDTMDEAALVPLPLVDRQSSGSNRMPDHINSCARPPKTIQTGNNYFPAGITHH
jgi:hypothetical protein